MEQSGVVQHLKFRYYSIWTHGYQWRVATLCPAPHDLIRGSNVCYVARLDTTTTHGHILGFLRGSQFLLCSRELQTA